MSSPASPSSPSCPPAASSKKSGGRKAVKESTKETKPPKETKKAVKEPATKVKAARAKAVKDTMPQLEVAPPTRAIASATSSLPKAPLKTKLGKCAPLKPRTLFIKHDSKKLPVHFIGNLLKIDDTDEKTKVSIEIDDVAYHYLCDNASQFSRDINFKYPVKEGKGKNAGHYYVSASLDDTLTASDISGLSRDTVEARGIIKTYKFNNDEGETITGCNMVLDFLATPAESPTGTTMSDAEDEDEEATA